MQDVYRHLHQLARDLFIPFLERYGLRLYDVDTLEVTPEGRAALEALVELPEDPNELPSELIDAAENRLVDAVIDSFRVPKNDAPVRAWEEEVEVVTEALPFPGIDENFPEGALPPQMDPRYRVPPYLEEIARKWCDRVLVVDECYLWQGGSASTSSPIFNYRQVTYSAARSGVWLLRKVYISTRTLPTRCGTRFCVNPDHLKPVGEL